jgi:NUDIX domain
MSAAAARPLTCLSGEMSHFETGDFKPNVKFLPDDVYGQALDSIVKACADVLVHTPGDAPKILLGHRIVEPQPDWWFAGGRMQPGERPKDAPGRLLVRELGFRIAPERLRHVASYSFLWARYERRCS